MAKNAIKKTYDQKANDLCKMKNGNEKISENNKRKMNK